MIINKRVHDHFIVNSYCDPSHIYKVDLPRWVLLFWWWGHPYSQVNFSPFSKLFSSPCCQSEYTQALLSLTKLRRQLLARAKRLTHFSYKRSLKLPRLGGGGPLTRDNLSSYKRGRKMLFVISYWTRSRHNPYQQTLNYHLPFTLLKL